MAQSQMLYIGRKGALTYAAPGNIDVGSGGRGSVSLWYHPCGRDQRGAVLHAGSDPNNILIVLRNQEEWVCRLRSGGTTWSISHVSGSVEWRHVVVTWDFTGGPGAGVVRFYLDGEEATGSPLTGVSAPLGMIEDLQIGPGTEHAHVLTRATYDQLCVWSEVMSAGEVSELFARGHLHRPESSDGSGEMMLRAGWDGQYDADIAEGSAVAGFVGATDQYCRLESGSRADGKRFSYRIGLPTHDQAETERVPLSAVLVPLQWGVVEETNTSEYGRLDVNASNNARAIGASLAPWLPSPEPPMTLRVGVHIPVSGAPRDLPIAVGGHSYFIGAQRRVLCGAGSSKTQIVSNDLTDADGYWDGAELHIWTGAARDQKVKVLTNSQSGQSATIDGELSAAPGAGDIAVLARQRRIEPFQVKGHLYRLEADLSEVHHYERFTMMETSICGDWGYSCTNLGRIQLYPYQIASNEVFFGKRDTLTHSQWECSFLIDRIEMDGPGRYELSGRSDDTFLVVDPATGESPRAALVSGLVRETREAQQHATPSEVQESFTKAGSWRDSVRYCPSWFRYDAREDRLVTLLVGRDPEGTERMGYLHGSWDDEAGIVRWEDDPDPRNPFLAVDDLLEVLDGRSKPYRELGMVNGVFEVAEGDWALVFTATIGNPDGMAACALLGAPDAYSFDPQVHFDRELNPLTPALAGRDKIVPEGGGIGLFGNRDCEPRFVENPWARSKSDRFWGYARAKTVTHVGDMLDYQLGRPLSCMVTGDFRNLRFKPWRNQIIAPVHGWFHWPHPEWYGPSTIGLLVDDGHVATSDVSLYASEDGVHMSRVKRIVPRNTPPFNAGYLQPIANPVRLGNRRLYWYRSGMSGNNLNVATIRLDGEALYRLGGSALEGELRTCALRREADTWDELRVNVAPRSGQVTVAVLDSATGAVVPGFDHADCDGISDGVGRRVSWNGVGLGEAPLQEIALEFRLRRSSTGDESPELYAWTIAPSLDADRPEVRAVRVEGRVNPARVANPQPVLSWEYSDRHDRGQTAYHLLVASSASLLARNEADLWDSGVVLSDEHEARYAGAALDSETTYFWKVRVRNSEGAWSELW